MKYAPELQVGLKSTGEIHFPGKKNLSTMFGMLITVPCGWTLKILFLTIKKVLLRDGISAAGEATMPEFQGVPSEANGDQPKNK